MLSGTNTYGGSTTISSGILQFSSPRALGGSGASLSIAPGATAAAGYPIDQANLGRPGHPGISRRRVHDRPGGGQFQPLEFQLCGANLTLAALGAIGSNLHGVTPSGTTYRFGGGGAGWA